MDPVSFIHDTEDGPIHLLVSSDKKGAWIARHWGHQLAGIRLYKTLAAANRGVRQTFRELFPEHVCTRRCGRADQVANDPRQSGLFGDN
jgi:hypothetical protein